MTCVTTFKAKCDGFADDTQALKDAVKYAHEAGDEISFPRGAIVKHTDADIRFELKDFDVELY